MAIVTISGTNWGYIRLHDNAIATRIRMRPRSLFGGIDMSFKKNLLRLMLQCIGIVAGLLILAWLIPKTIEIVTPQFSGKHTPMAPR